MDKPDPGLGKTVATASGGGYFDLTRTQRSAPPTFARVADELHRQYLLGFVPQKLDGKRPQARSAREG